MTDPRAESVVQDALSRVSQNKTTLVIAHKLATIKAADNIVVMAHGQIIEQGTHTELIARKGHYATLVSAQDLGGRSGKSELDEEKLEALDNVPTLQRTNTDISAALTGVKSSEVERGTLNYSLVRCVLIMLAEQKDLYLWMVFGSFACLVGGATFPAQALLYSRLLKVFTLSGHQAKTQADFFALMFFVVALANLVAYWVIGWSCAIVSSFQNPTKLELSHTDPVLDWSGCDTPLP